MSEDIVVTINGEPVPARNGVTVGSILHAHLLALRASPLLRAPRGLYCGMGVCFECVVSVDGEPTRACITPARDGMRVEVSR